MVWHQHIYRTYAHRLLVCLHAVGFVQRPAINLFQPLVFPPMADDLLLLRALYYGKAYQITYLIRKLVWHNFVHSLKLLCLRATDGHFSALENFCVRTLNIDI